MISTKVPGVASSAGLWYNDGLILLWSSDVGSILDPMQERLISRMSDTISHLTYYVYILSYPDGTVFYVGKGSGDRLHHHLRDARDITNRSYKARTIRAIIASGAQVQFRVLAAFEMEQHAFVYESAMIRLYRNLYPEYMTNESSGTSQKFVAPDVFIDMASMHRQFPRYETRIPIEPTRQPWDEF